MKIQDLPRPRPAQVRGMLLIALTSALIDWAVKYFHWWDSIPHRTERPIEAIALCLILCLVLLTIVPRRFMMVGCGLLMGGTIGNLLDLTVDGVVWDMIPLPDNIYANTADFSIFAGILVLVIGLICHFIALWRGGYFLAAEDR